VDAAPVPLCATGMGNSPPARKLATWPETAVRFGSANTVTSPSSASASMIELTPTRRVLTPSKVELGLPGSGERRTVTGVVVGESGTVLPSAVRPVRKPKLKEPGKAKVSQLK